MSWGTARPNAHKRVVSRDGLTHGFHNHINEYDTREAVTFCDEPVWENGMRFDGWKVVPARPITCLRCLGRR